MFDQFDPNFLGPKLSIPRGGGAFSGGSAADQRDQSSHLDLTRGHEGNDVTVPAVTILRLVKYVTYYEPMNY